MTRPAVVIGLGGTGQWILTYLKKDLLELNNGKMPKNVRLLAFDTVSQAEASAVAVGQPYVGNQAEYEKTAKRIGSVELDPDLELVHIGGDCRPLADQIESGKYPHLDWFDVKYWKNEAGLSRDNWILDRGAGRFRPFGLLAVYKDLLGGPVRSEILKRLPAAINEVVGADSSFEIILVSSVAGGTGSAMLVPFGVLAQKLCGNYSVKTRAVVVLPSAFSPGRPNAELELRGGAALRELARAMIYGYKGYKSKVTFVPNDRLLGNVEYERPFDGVYFIDGIRNGNPINDDPKYSVFPAAAGWIRQILDEQSGAWFTNYIATNRAGATDDPTRRAEGVFGVFGVKSLFAPERTLRQTYQLKLADQVLKEITGAERVAGRTSGPSSEKFRFVPNPQPAGMPQPLDLASQWLQNPAQYGDNQEQSTSLFSHIAYAVANGGKNSADLVNAQANAGWSGKSRRERQANSWHPKLCTLPDSSKFEETRKMVAIEGQADFYAKFRPSNESSPPRDPGNSQVFLDFTQNIDAFRHDHYGGMGADGVEDYGSYGQMARMCAADQVSIFKEILRLQLLNLLNGTPGRLAYAMRVVREMDELLKGFEEFLAEVARVRNQRSPRVSLQDELNARRASWMRDRTTQPTLVERLQKKSSAVALKSEKAMLQAHGNLYDFVREETLHEAVTRATRACRSTCQQTAKELNRWLATLLMGDTALDIKGLSATVADDLDRLTTTIQADRRSSEIEQLVQVASRESKIDQSELDWAMAGVAWQAEITAGQLQFHLALNPEGVNTGTLQVIREGMEPGERRAVEAANQQTLAQVFDQRFGQEEQVQEILKWCRNDKEYSDVDKLAADLHEGTQPLTSSVSAAPVMEGICISVKRDNDPTGYADRLEIAVRKKVRGSERPDTNNPVAVLNSEDPYRLTAVRTQVGLLLDEFDTWSTCENAYNTELGKLTEPGTDRGQLVRSLQSQYTQNAEKEAVALEAQWRSAGLAHRVLNPRVVSLLSARRNLQIALQCWAMGWVEQMQDKDLPDRYHWQLTVPGWGYEYWITPNKDGRNSADDLEALEAFVLLSKNHARGREGSPLDWVSLNQALIAAREVASPEMDSPLKQALQKALQPEGVTARWRQLAGSFVDPNTDKESFRNAAYRDLSDFAEQYYKSVEG